MGFDRKWYGHHPGDSEMSWGPGLVPPGKEHALPSERGMYRPKCPDMTEPPRSGPLRSDEPPRGYPGEQIA